MSSNGFLLLDKPVGPTSFDAVKMARRIFQTKKAGHCGTLDPLASGLMIIAIGNATRLIPFLPAEPKVYEFGLQFGKSTTTLDSQGEFTIEGEPIPNKSDILNILPTFIGELKQSPPKYSAVKINGVRAYKLARNNQEFKTKERTINISNLKLIDFNEDSGIANISVSCSSGTYVRVLCEQIAQRLNSAGYAVSIRRTNIGEFSLSQAILMDKDNPQLLKSLHTSYETFKTYPSHIASDFEISELSFGRRLKGIQSNAPVLFLYSNKRDLVAVVERTSGGIYSPKKVFV